MVNQGKVSLIDSAACLLRSHSIAIPPTAHEGHVNVGMAKGVQLYLPSIPKAH